MKTNLDKYVYDGPYYKFGQYVEKIHIETLAITEAKAITNIKYQIKKKLGLSPSANISILTSNIKKY